MPALDGARVLVTRPAHQAGPLCELIAQAGGKAVAYPVLAIAGPQSPHAVRDTVKRLGHYHIAIFVSPNAVAYGLDFMQESGPLPAGLILACVGKGSADKLQAHLGRPPDVVPQGRFDSETLLAHPALQGVKDTRILIVRGDGGREMLAQTLRRRGAQVDYLEVYRRTLPEPVPPWPQPIDIITLTSSEGLKNLYRMAGAEHRQQLLSLPLVVVSQRTAALARELGFRQAVTVADNASDQALLEAVARNIHD